jgi:hypothetical protein
VLSTCPLSSGLGVVLTASLRKKFLVTKSDVKEWKRICEAAKIVPELYSPWIRVLLEMLIVAQPDISLKPKVSYRVHNNVSQDPILNQVYPDHDATHYLRFILILSSHLRLGLPSDLFTSCSSTNILYACLTIPCVLRAPPISHPLLLSP